jgi:hypothetical protein
MPVTGARRARAGPMRRRQHALSEKYRSHEGAGHLRSRRRRQTARQNLWCLPQALLAALAELGFKGSYQKKYTHRDGGRVLDLHFEKDGTDVFKGWKADECSANLAALDSLFSNLGISVARRVMSMAEAYA